MCINHDYIKFINIKMLLDYLFASNKPKFRQYTMYYTLKKQDKFGDADGDNDNNEIQVNGLS